MARRGYSDDAAINVQSLTGGGGSSSSLFTIIAIIVLAIIGYYVYKNRGSMLAPAHEETPAVDGEIPDPSVGSGIDPSPTCPSGETCVEDDQGRYDCDESKGDSYESTWCGSFSGDDLTIKLYGPKHSSDGDCCWCVLHVKPDSGQFVGGGEGPHPSSNCEDKGDGESIGTTSDICVKAVIQPGPHVTGYALVDGAWKQMIDYTGDCGCDETSSEKTGDQVTFRNDGNFETTCATVKEYGGDGGGTTTPAPTTPTTPTTPPANGEDEEEDEPAEDEEEPAEDEEDSGNVARVLSAAFIPSVRRERRFVNSFKEFNSLSYRGIRLGNF